MHEAASIRIGELDLPDEFEFAGHRFSFPRVLYRAQAQFVPSKAAPG
jgi:hypothetical protein